MKKITLVLTGCLSLAVLMPVRALAVWAPSTSLEGSQSQPSPEQLRQALLKVQEDEKRLQEALTELKKDEEQLKQLLGERKESPSNER